MSRFTVALLLVAMLAGCADAPAPEQVDDEFGFDEADVGETTGAITGVVVDASINPIAGAVVSLDDGTSTTTGEGGTFVFEDLQPGIHFMTASAERFLPVQVTSEVTAGTVSKARIVLPMDPTPGPYASTVKFDGFIRAYAGIASYVVQLLAPDAGVCTCQFTTTPGPGFDTFVYEVTWEPSLDLQVNRDLYWELDSYDADGRLLDQEGGFEEGPIVHHMPRDLYSQPSVEWLVRVTGGTTGPNVDQSYQLFLTEFYHAPPPTDWSLLAGDANPY